MPMPRERVRVIITIFCPECNKASLNFFRIFDDDDTFNKYLKSTWVPKYETTRYSRSDIDAKKNFGDFDEVVIVRSKCSQHKRVFVKV